MSSVQTADCNWPKCHGSPNPCFAWCKCRCHTKAPDAAMKRVTLRIEATEDQLAILLTEWLHGPGTVVIHTETGSTGEVRLTYVKEQ